MVHCSVVVFCCHILLPLLQHCVPNVQDRLWSLIQFLLIYLEKNISSLLRTERMSWIVHSSYWCCKVLLNGHRSGIGVSSCFLMNRVLCTVSLNGVLVLQMRVSSFPQGTLLICLYLSCLSSFIHFMYEFIVHWITPNIYGYYFPFLDLSTFYHCLPQQVHFSCVSCS